MHSSRMRTARSLIVYPYLVVSQPRPPPPFTTHAPLRHACPPFTMHAPFDMHGPFTMHAPPTTMHAPWQPCMPSTGNHACPLQPCMPLDNQAHPPGNHACHPGNHACPPATIHAPWQPRTPAPMNRITHACENITLPQLRCGRLKY